MTENAVLDREASLKELEIKRQQYYDEMRNEIKDEITRLRKKVFTSSSLSLLLLLLLSLLLLLFTRLKLN